MAHLSSLYQFRASANRTASYLPSSVCFIDEIDHLMGEGSEARTSPANRKGWDHTQESQPPHSETEIQLISLVYKKETLHAIVMVQIPLYPLLIQTTAKMLHLSQFDVSFQLKV